MRTLSVQPPALRIYMISSCNMEMGLGSKPKLLRVGCCLEGISCYDWKHIILIFLYCSLPWKLPAWSIKQSWYTQQCDSRTGLALANLAPTKQKTRWWSMMSKQLLVLTPRWENSLEDSTKQMEPWRHCKCSNKQCGTNDIHLHLRIFRIYFHFFRALGVPRLTTSSSSPW